MSKSGRTRRRSNAPTALQQDHPVSNRKLFTAVALLLFGLFYLWLAWVTSGQSDLWILTTIDGAQLYTIDDAYRYYLARTAWLDPDLYHWNYVLPLALFADGVSAFLTGGDLFAMRAMHIPGALATLWFTWRAGCNLGIQSRWMLPSVLLLALMPLYVFVFLSFYGEAWMTLCLMAGVWCLTSNRQQLAALCFALLPLIRPEGIYFVVPLGLWWLGRKEWRLLVILGTPGFLYSLYLLVRLDAVADYTAWRLALMSILHQSDHPALYQTTGFLSAFNPFWTFPALLGMTVALSRKMLPVYLGALIFFAVLTSLVVARQALHEARYYVCFLPLIAIANAAFWAACAEKFHAWRRYLFVLFPVLTMLITAEHFLQLDPLKYAAGDRRWPVSGMPSGARYFPALSEAANRRRADVATAVSSIVRNEERIDRVMIQNTEIFYHLDPDIGVPVSYVPTNEYVAQSRAAGLFYGMHSHDDHHAFYRLRRATFSDRKLAIYVGSLSGMALEPLFTAGVFSVYLVAYEERPRPDLTKEVISQ